MKKIILCAFVLGFIYAFGAGEAKAQEGCKNYLGRANQSLCSEKKGYDECVASLKNGGRDLCIWTGDPASRIERQTVQGATDDLIKKGCTKEGIGIFNCGDGGSVTGKAAYNVCIGYKNFGAVRQCLLTVNEKAIKAKRPDAFELGVQMGRLMYFALLTENEWKKNKTMNFDVYNKYLNKRKEARKFAEQAVLAINAAIPDKSQHLKADKLFADVDPNNEGKVFTIFNTLKTEYGAMLTKNYKVLSDAYYLGADIGIADGIVQNSDAAQRSQAVNALTMAVGKATDNAVYDKSHSEAIAEVAKSTPLVNAYFKVFDLRTLYKEKLAKN